MIIINCTKAAANFLGASNTHVISPAPTETVLDTQCDGKPVWQWLLHQVEISKQPALVITEVDTRFSMVFSLLEAGKPDVFEQLFIERWAHHILARNIDYQLCGLPALKKMLDAFVQQSHTVYCQRGDRSTQAVVNDIAWHFENQIYEKQCFPDNQSQAAGFDKWANSMIRKHKHHPDYFSPVVEMIIKFFTVHGDGVARPSDDEIRERYKALLRKESLAHGLSL